MDNKDEFIKKQTELAKYDYGEQIKLIDYKAPSFFLELIRGNYQDSQRIVIDCNHIVEYKIKMELN